MHNIENYGGVRLEPNVAPGLIKVQFPTVLQMKAWLERMRSYYNGDQFSPCVNEEDRIVVY